MITFGARVFGLGIVALGLVCLAFREFDFGQSVPKDFPARTALAYAAAVFMALAGAAIQWRRTVTWGAAALAVYFALIVVILMDGRTVIAHYAEYGAYSSVAAHVFYMNLTAPLVPEWLPLSGEFWGYATGIAHIAAGVAILARIQARLAAILLTIMYASFTPLVHVPLLVANPSSHWIWSENVLNLILAGVAWVVADSL